MSERRGDLRDIREERLFVKVIPSGGDPDEDSLIISCSTKDASSSGVSLQLSEALPEAADVELWVKVKGCPGKFLLNGVVRWCRPEGEEFLCGIELFEADKLSDLPEWQELFA